MPAAPPTRPLTQRELVHRVNNFLSLVMTSGQAALDEKLSYDPERALGTILEGAEELTGFLRERRSPRGGVE